jgi:hypothetical protein
MLHLWASHIWTVQILVTSLGVKGTLIVNISQGNLLVDPMVNFSLMGPKQAYVLILQLNLWGYIHT